MSVRCRRCWRVHWSADVDIGEDMWIHRAEKSLQEDKTW